MPAKSDRQERKRYGRSALIEPDPVIEAYKKDIDRTLLLENLKLSVEQRFLKLCELQRLAAELRKARAASTP
jgi:hypothetical protein